MARLQLARALFGSENRAKSAQVYEDFLNLWENADPDIPLVIQIKAEYAEAAAKAGRYGLKSGFLKPAT
jgi:hypothetical protein